MPENLSEKVSARAEELFNGGFNCAEAVATAVAEHFKPGQVCFPRAATCFGGGLGRRGETCGALVGALLALGLVKGRDPGEGDEAKKRAYALAETVVEGFRGQAGSVLCRELLGVDLREREGREAFVARDLHHAKCVPLVVAAARLGFENLNR